MRRLSQNCPLLITAKHRKRSGWRSDDTQSRILSYSPFKSIYDESLFSCIVFASIFWTTQRRKINIPSHPSAVLKNDFGRHATVTLRVVCVYSRGKVWNCAYRARISHGPNIRGDFRPVSLGTILLHTITFDPHQLVGSTVKQDSNFVTNWLTITIDVLNFSTENRMYNSTVVHAYAQLSIKSGYIRP